MSKQTPIYHILYLENGDKIYAGYDSDNMNTLENQIFGMYDYLGQGVIEGWQIVWMGCRSNPYVMQQRQALIDAYNANPFSYLALEYELIGKPGVNDESAWEQCIVVTPGLGIVDVFHAATESPSFFRFTSANHYYVWAEKNVCTNTEYLCDITAPQYPDEDFDLYNKAIYLGEVFVTTISGTPTITQIIYSERRRSLKGADSDVQRLLKQALINHVHTGDGDMPSKIVLDSKLTITVNIIVDSNTFIFTPPQNPSNYDVPQVYLNSNLLQINQYQISGGTLYLQNSVTVGSVLQIVYQFAPGSAYDINANTTVPVVSTPLNYNVSYIVTNGSIITNPDESQFLVIFKWNPSVYSEILVNLNGIVLDPVTYVLNGTSGTILFNGPILPSISNYKTSDVQIKFVTPSIQIKGKLSSNKISSIDAGAVKSGTIPNFRLSALDHLGLFRLDEPANIIPYKKLLDSGDHVHFYPYIDFPVQHSDYILYSIQTLHIKVDSAETSTPARTIFSTPTGLFATKNSPESYNNIVQMSWNTDNGVPSTFAENYFGNFSTYSLPNFVTSTLNPKYFWVLTKTKNQFTNLLYLSTDFGISFRKITLPLTSSNTIVNVNDFISTVDVYQYTTGEVILTPHIAANYLYYLAGNDGLYTASFTPSQNPTKPIWATPNKNTTDSPTGALNKISEAVNVGVITTTHEDGLTEKDYQNYRTLYAACDNGLFVYQSSNGTKFSVTSYNSTYNQNSSKFSFVYWLGNDDNLNIPEALVWSDSYGFYYSNSSQEQITVSGSSTYTTTTTAYYQPLSIAGANVVSVVCASTENIDLNQLITNIDGFSLSVDSNVLLKNQTDSSQNGLYLWSATTKQLTLLSTKTLKIYVQNGSQKSTEWNELLADSNNPSQRQFALYYANLFSINSNDYIVGVCKDRSRGPNSIAGQIYQNSFFAATQTTIYRVLNFSTPNMMPVVIQIAWDSNKYGNITNIQHYSSVGDSDNGTLVVLTENGIFESTSSVFNDSELSYQRFVQSFSPNEGANATVYDNYTGNEYTGKITSLSLVSTATTLLDGTYLNQPIFSNNASGIGLTVDFMVRGGVIVEYNINNPGKNYTDDFSAAFCNTNGVIISFQSIITEGMFIADSDSQAFVYSKGSGINPSRLIYETSYTNFFINPWGGFPLILIKINGVIVNQSYTYDSSSGRITFSEGLDKLQKDKVTVTLTNRGQYISSAGETPHAEVFNIVASDSTSAAKLKSTYDPTTAKDNILPIDRFDNSLWNSSVNTVKITGLRSSTTNSNIQLPYTEILQVSVNIQTQKVYIISKPTTLSLTQNSLVYIGRTYSDLLGIEDYLSLSKSKLTYHLNSASHANVYNLYNSLLNVIPNLFSYPTLGNETLSGVDRGLKNTIALRSLNDFDPSATFVGYSFGVDPSSTDVAAAPSNINLILDFKYGDNPIFATDKGIWTYIRASAAWIKTDTVDQSQLIYFANKALVDSTNTSNIYAGTNKGLYFEYQNIYTKNALFDEPILSLNMGSWFTNATNTTQRFEAYGKESGLSFVLRSTNTISGSISFKSDFFAGHKIYDIYYNTFYRYDENNNRTEHPAIYLATDSSIWAFTTDSSPNSPTLISPHTLLYGREMFGGNIITNPNKINPSLPGLPSKIFKILEIPSGGKNTWLVFCTSNGVYVVINWKQCDVGDPSGLVFFPQNLHSHNETVGRQCYCITAKINDNNGATYFVGTDQGVFKSSDRCGDWVKIAKFNNQNLSVSDITYFVDGANNGYLLATTNVGLWVSNDDGDSWSTISSFSDNNVAINTLPTFGSPLNQSPQQVFTTITTGTVAKAFVYFNPQNLTSQTTLYASISNGAATTQSSSSVSLTKNSFPGMYGFTFNNCALLPNINYKLGVVTDSAIQAPLISWGLSNLSNPYSAGYAQTSGGVITNKDFFFRINLNTPAAPTEIIEPVGFYNSLYPVGFSEGNYVGASISSTGYLYSNVGLVCNVVLDTSKSFEINDTGIITNGGISTSYVKEAIINALVPKNSETTNLYSRLKNVAGVSKMLISVYGFNNSINDLLFFSSTNSNDPSSCFSSSSQNFEGYTNNPAAVQSSIIYSNNAGRLSKLYDAVLYNSRLQYPQVVTGFYSANYSLIDLNFINIQSAASVYKTNFENYLTLNLTLISGQSYTISYQSNSSAFLWNESSYGYILIYYSDGTFAESSYAVNGVGYVNNTSGIFNNAAYSSKTPTSMFLSKNWDFDISTGDLSSSYSVWSLSPEALNIVTDQYSKSFKPLMIIATDGNDNSQALPIGVNSSLIVAWNGAGSQVLVVEPDSSGNENNLRTMIENTNSKVFKYNSYPEKELKAILVNDDNLDLFSSSWSRNYDFSDLIFISRIFTSFVTPGNSSAKVSFKWSKDRVNFSDYISLPNGVQYNLNQKVSSIYYKIDLTEDYNGGRLLPYITSLYHVQVVPATQTYLSYPKNIDGQLFETLALASFSNNDLVEITPIVGRTANSDISYYEQIQLNRNSCLSNRQSSFKITSAYTVTNLLLFPAPDNTGAINYKIFYIIDNNSNIYTWDSTDLFTLYAANNAPVAPGGYTVDSTNGKIAFQNPLNSQIGNQLQYQTYTATISYSEKKSSIIGEPTTTYDFKTYYLRNGRIPSDATIVVLINQKIYKGGYYINYYDGSITFSSTLDVSDYVTVFIKFASSFRAGLQIQSYSKNNLNLQSFNFTYTSLDDLPTYEASFDYTKPYLTGSPLLSPSSLTKINSTLNLSYNYVDDNNTPEVNSDIFWWRYRSGIEYVTFSPTISLIATGGSFIGINTFNVESIYNQNGNPFILSVTTFSTGVSTNITSVLIVDRGTNFIGTSTSLNNSVVLNNGVSISNIGAAITAHVLIPSVSPGYATSDYFVRINPASPIGYSTSFYGWPNNAPISPLPLYDGRIIESPANVGGRTLFDARDQIFCTVRPNNGFTFGNTYQSNVIEISPYYVPSVDSVYIIPYTSTSDGISTSLSISASVDHSVSYNWASGVIGINTINQFSTNPNSNNTSVVGWYKLTSLGGSLITKSSSLPSTLININDQIFCTVLPGVKNTDGTIGVGNTVSSDIYNVTS